jgi:hypothetical protein
MNAKIHCLVECARIQMSIDLHLRDSIKKIGWSLSDVRVAVNEITQKDRCNGSITLGYKEPESDMYYGHQYTLQYLENGDEILKKKCWRLTHLTDWASEYRDPSGPIVYYYEAENVSPPGIGDYDGSLVIEDKEEAMICGFVALLIEHGNFKNVLREEFLLDG